MDVGGNPVTWTPDLLKEHLDRLLAELGLRMDERFMGSDRWVGERFADFARQINERFEAVRVTNDAALRAAQDAVTKTEVAMEKRFDTVDEKLTLLQQRVDQSEGRHTGIGASVTLFVAALAILVSIGTSVLTLVLRGP